MQENQKMHASLKPREIILERWFAAPIGQVYAAWTHPEYIKQWWSPQGCTTPVAELDVRVGGALYIVMEDPEGVKYPMRGEYMEVVPNQKLVMATNLEEHSEEWKKNILQAAGNVPVSDILHTGMKAEFTEQDGGTLLRVTSTFSSDAVRDGFVSTGMNEGWRDLFNKLEGLLASLS